MRMFVLCILFFVSLICLSQSKRSIPPIPDRIDNISVRIVESISYNSYFGRVDDSEDWFSRDDVGSQVYIYDDKICFQIKNNKGKLFSFFRYVMHKDNLYSLAHNKEDYWKSDEPDGEKGSFGFTVKKDNDLEFHIKIIPVKEDKFHTEISVKKGEKFIWIFYCKNFL